MLRNTRESWGGVAKTLHWSAAAVVFAMLGLGLTMVHGELGAVLGERVGDEAGRVHVVVPDDEHSHRGQPPCSVAEIFVWCQTI